MRALAVVVAALALAGSAGAGSQPISPVISNCGEYFSAPASITLTCADANYALAGLKWKDWGSPNPVATGHATSNDCTPNCAAGHFHNYPATATASKPQTCLYGKVQYTRLVVHYPGARPKGIARDDVWTFACDAPGPGAQLTVTAAGRMVTITGAGWPPKGCGPVTLTYARTTVGLIGTKTPGSNYAFTLKWNSPVAGKLVIRAQEQCGAGLYARAARVTVS